MIKASDREIIFLDAFQKKLNLANFSDYTSVQDGSVKLSDARSKANTRSKADGSVGLNISVLASSLLGIN